MAAGAALSAAPFILTAEPGKKFRTALVGSGWWGKNILREAMASGRIQVVALCDADTSICRLAGEPRADRLSELNVIEQVANVWQTTVVRDAWTRGQELTVHGWIYGLRDGRLRDLNCTAGNPAEAAANYTAAVAAVTV